MKQLILWAAGLLFLSGTTMQAQSKKTLRYIALGDSYTICTGTNDASQSWPAILAKHLTEAGIPVQLTANPSRNGFSTQNLIDRELPVLDAQGADVVTLLIGVNDWVRQVDANTFHQNLNAIIDHVLGKLSNKQYLLLITIPDFGVTPSGAGYGSGRDISKGIAEFNAIIEAEAKKRGLGCVDLFAVSKQMKDDPSLVAADGLHPSAKEYAIWETLIFPVMKKLLAQ